MYRWAVYTPRTLTYCNDNKGTYMNICTYVSHGYIHTYMYDTKTIFIYKLYIIYKLLMFFSNKNLHSASDTMGTINNLSN